jgi:hypothetical protein
MQLHGPAAPGVHTPDIQQHGGLERIGLLRGERDGTKQLGKNSLQCMRRRECGKGYGQAIIGIAATQS